MTRLYVVLVFLVVLSAVCIALDIPWNPSIGKADEAIMFRLNKNKNGRVLKPTPPKSDAAIHDLHRQYDNPQWLFFISTEILVDTTANSSSSSFEPLMEWEFVSHMTITPEQCGIITNVVQMLDEALQHANPDVQNVSSRAFRLGNNMCSSSSSSIDSVCPCDRRQEEGQQNTTDKDRSGRRGFIISSSLLLEVKTRSSSSQLRPPLQFPLRRVASFL